MDHLSSVDSSCQPTIACCAFGAVLPRSILTNAHSIRSKSTNAANGNVCVWNADKCLRCGYLYESLIAWHEPLCPNVAFSCLSPPWNEVSLSMRIGWNRPCLAHGSHGLTMGGQVCLVTSGKACPSRDARKHKQCPTSHACDGCPSSALAHSSCTIVPRQATFYPSSREETPMVGFPQPVFLPPFSSGSIRS